MEITKEFIACFIEVLETVVIKDTEIQSPYEQYLPYLIKKVKKIRLRKDGKLWFKDALLIKELFNVIGNEIDNVEHPKWMQ